MSSSLDPSIWKSIAGASVGRIPAVGSLVYYFPQGHAEQSSSLIDFSSIATSKPYSLCRVSSVRLLANPDSDEVFARIHLDPSPSAIVCLSPSPEVNADVVSFAKILTPSDSNNGGGFSMPRFCADSIFPELDFKADPPLQKIWVNDVHGKSWEFRHIYRGTPRRHLLTSGWSRFVNCKKLVAGDSVVFIKNGEGKLFVGIRRTGRFYGNLDYLKLDEKFSNVGVKNGFSRNLKGRVLAESIVEAIRLMEMGREFDVLYYPRAGSPEFVVQKEVVENSLGFYWSEGMRVKMSVETEDSSKMTWFHGIVSRKDIKNPWRMLQVTWDEPEVLPNIRAVSPWQVELVSIFPCLQAQFPVFKRPKIQQAFKLSSEGYGNILFPQSLTSVKMGHSTPLLNNPTFPAGMQGARHDFSVPSLSNFVHRNTNHMLSNNMYSSTMPEESNTSHLEVASPPSQESIHNHGLELLELAACEQTRKLSKGSFQLFGQIIHMDQPDDDNVDGERAVNENIRSLEFSLLSHNVLFNGVEVRHRGIPAVEACYL